MAKPRCLFKTRVVKAPSGAWRAQIISYEGVVTEVAKSPRRDEAWDILRQKRKELNEQQ